MKAQVLADFLVECTWSDDELKEVPIELPTRPPDMESTWILHMDGTSNSEGSGVGLILANSKGVIAEYTLRFLFKVINNQPEYKTLLARLKLVKGLKVQRVRVFTDSQLIAGQVTGMYKSRDLVMAKYLDKVQILASML